MSQQRQKGTGFETEQLPWIRRIWPDAGRAGTTLGGADYGDFTNIGPYLIEAKKHNSWRVSEWIRTILKKKGGHYDWMLVMAMDRRKLPGTYVLMPVELAEDLLEQSCYGELDLDSE